MTTLCLSCGLWIVFSVVTGPSCRRLRDFGTVCHFSLQYRQEVSIFLNPIIDPRLSVRPSFGCFYGELFLLPFLSSIRFFSVNYLLLYYAVASGELVNTQAQVIVSSVSPGCWSVSLPGSIGSVSMRSSGLSLLSATAVSPPAGVSKRGYRLANGHCWNILILNTTIFS